jgi:hypothetical protein
MATSKCIAEASVHFTIDLRRCCGVIQAVRFDDNATSYRTEWKAIAVNSDYTNVLLYNLTADISESAPLSGTPVGPDSTVSRHAKVSSYSYFDDSLCIRIVDKWTGVTRSTDKGCVDVCFPIRRRCAWTTQPVGAQRSRKQWHMR